MGYKIEEIIKAIYQRFHRISAGNTSDCPDEETIVCFCEGRLSKEAAQNFKKHILKCERCAQIVTLYQLDIDPKKAVPDFLLKEAKNLLNKPLVDLLEIKIAIKKKFIELINSTGDVVLNNEIFPMPVLRSRKIKNLREEIEIVKEFKDLKINVNIEQKHGFQVKVIIKICDKNTSLPIENLRISLMKDNIELESYLIDSGSVIFDKVTSGNYNLRIFQNHDLIGLINLNIK